MKQKYSFISIAFLLLFVSSSSLFAPATFIVKVNGNAKKIIVN